MLKPKSVPFLAKVYINHGGGPLPLLGKQPGIAEFLGSYAGTLPRKPTAILVVTAHWETGSELKVSGGKAHSLYFDYGGFPKATKHIFGGFGQHKQVELHQDFGLTCLLRSETIHIYGNILLFFPHFFQSLTRKAMNTLIRHLAARNWRPASSPSSQRKV